MENAQKCIHKLNMRQIERCRHLSNLTNFSEKKLITDFYDVLERRKI